ncbi:MAG: threonylcarbamoyl-AMP synthase [Nitrosopumilaceae archaeon]|nr:threonylcarbamoyl-AMP synthase [Nitrosopumilaceae archaeon]NIT99491.1 threonylcarbamoyl-AMP synthase [Nitrosopumilaceae archaeon]NIU85850.1 threonylcarbamoyl-AMP synthase [Nitrosopumilaceae archaeon]NIV64707.1 threonylcarbamoyl-AMP synthase [Nitrosopumilaceae archaeon]NIX60094.1 threonylcarbamoyl-AMP synthase [Nitrosopumilaceae archaeon]
MRLTCDDFGVRNAVDVIQEGGVIVYPTDTVYGIGCDPFDRNAVNRIYDIKKRSKDKSLPILGYDKEVLEKIACFDKNSNKLAEEFWPGVLTLVLKLRDKKLGRTLNLDDKIAVRVPSNECIRSVLRECKILVGTSANISESGSFTDPDLCYQNIKGFDLFLDGGRLQGSGESTVVDVNEKKILRMGAIPKAKVERFL